MNSIAPHLQNERKSMKKDSKLSRRLSLSSQLPKSSLQLIKKLHDEINNGSINYNEFQILLSRNNEIHPHYIQTLINCKTKALIHVGIYLQIKNILPFLSQLFATSSQNLRALQKLKQTSELQQKIFFIPFWQYTLQQCTILFWLCNSGSQKYQINKNQLTLMSSYCQLIITTRQNLQQLHKCKIQLQSWLNFEQQIILLQRNKMFQQNYSSQRSIKSILELRKKQFQTIVLQLMKRNSYRCIQQTLIINRYILSLLSCFTQDNIQNSQQQIISIIFEKATSLFLAQQIQLKHEQIVQKYKTNGAKNQKQLQFELTTQQQLFIHKVKTNSKILRNASKQRQLLEATQKKLSINNQQILSNNRELAKKQNNKLLQQLFEKLLNNFEDKRYNHKDRINRITQDFQIFLQQYEKKSIKSYLTFSYFNIFMKNNKSRYFQRIQGLQNQTNRNKKSINFDEIYDKMEIKKKVLYTLQNEVKQLNNKKSQIQSKNEELKQSLQSQFERQYFQTEGDEFFETDSIKTIKSKQIMTMTPRSQKIKTTLQQSYVQLPQKKHKKKSCIDCCKCNIF